MYQLLHRVIGLRYPRHPKADRISIWEAVGRGCPGNPPTGGSLHSSHFRCFTGFQTSLSSYPYTLFAHIVPISEERLPLTFEILHSLKVQFKCHFVQ